VLLENEPDAATAALIGGKALKAALGSLDK
jgi:hypothetical protein